MKTNINSLSSMDSSARNQHTYTHVRTITIEYPKEIQFPNEFTYIYNIVYTLISVLMLLLHANGPEMVEVSFYIIQDKPVKYAIRIQKTHRGICWMVL